MVASLLFVVPLALDSFAVAAALGALRPSRRERWRISALFVAFEGGMPLVGLALGAPLAGSVAGIADYLAAAALIAVGGWMLLWRDESAEEERIRRLRSTHGLAVTGLGIAISFDELAIGFSLGLARLSIVVVVVAIAAQAFVAVQLGLFLGGHIRERLRERIERLAAVLLIGLGILLAFSP